MLPSKFGRKRRNKMQSLKKLKKERKKERQDWKKDTKTNEKEIIEIGEKRSINNKERKEKFMEKKLKKMTERRGKSIKSLKQQNDWPRYVRCQKFDHFSSCKLTNLHSRCICILQAQVFNILWECPVKSQENEMVSMNIAHWPYLLNQTNICLRKT